MPLLRYWTNDITYLTHEACACGRTHVKMGAIRGRSDDMLIVRGVNLYPTQVEEVLLGIPEVVPHYQVIVSREGTLDEVEVKVELTDQVFREIAEEAITDDVIEANQQNSGFAPQHSTGHSWHAWTQYARLAGTSRHYSTQ